MDSSQSGKAAKENADKTALAKEAEKLFDDLSVEMCKELLAYIRLLIKNRK